MSILVAMVGLAGLMYGLQAPATRVIPPLLVFVPYFIFVVAAAIPSERQEAVYLLVSTGVALIPSTYLYIDALKLNFVLGWQSAGWLLNYMPWLQLAVGVPAFTGIVVRNFRRWRG